VNGGGSIRSVASPVSTPSSTIGPPSSAAAVSSENDEYVTMMSASAAAMTVGMAALSQGCGVACGACPHRTVVVV